VARGFIPAGLRSGPQTSQLGVRKIEFTVLGLLRSPAGINPLATGLGWLVWSFQAKHITLWERACSRSRRHSHHRCGLTYRYREQARSHTSVWSIDAWACTFMADAPPSAFVARELAPAGLRSRPLFCGRFAPKREQAPSPRVGVARSCVALADPSPAAIPPIVQSDFSAVTRFDSLMADPAFFVGILTILRH
jgi:hypothetical protein